MLSLEATSTAGGGEEGRKILFRLFSASNLFKLSQVKLERKTTRGEERKGCEEQQLTLPYKTNGNTARYLD